MQFGRPLKHLGDLAFQPAAQLAHALVHLSQRRLARLRPPGQPCRIDDIGGAQRLDERGDALLCLRVVPGIVVKQMVEGFVTFAIEKMRVNSQLKASSSDHSRMKIPERQPSL